MKVLIVGGVAGGASAAARARRLSESAEIILFERGPDVSFANCGLPYYVGGEITERKKLLVTTAEMLRARFNLDVRTLSSVEGIDRDDDLKIGIKTSAITFGRFDVAAVMFCYAATLGIIGWVGYTLHMGWAFFAGLAVAAGIMGVHYTWIRGRERMACFKAFLHNNYVGAAIFAGIVVDFLVSGRSFG